jgi:[acyl-carrier-protein] S-malonyltransferase
MGKDLAAVYDTARQVFAEADEVLGFDLSRIIFEGSAEDLEMTTVTQPAVLTTSVALLRVLQERGIDAEGAAGLSLGEYTALVASNALTFAEAVKLVFWRGQFMQQAVPAGLGGMAAIIGLDRGLVEKVCVDASAATGRLVVPANYNCPSQIVVAGETPAVEQAMQMAKQAGAKRAQRLAVSAPFHTSLLKLAAERLLPYLEEVRWNQPQIPVVQNASAGYYNGSREDLIDSLYRQVMSPVKWEDCFRRLTGDGFDTFIEVGPGTALAGFARRIDPSVRVMSFGDTGSLESVMEALEMGASA